MSRVASEPATSGFESFRPFEAFAICLPPGLVQASLRTTTSVEQKRARVLFAFFCLVPSNGSNKTYYELPYPDHSLNFQLIFQNFSREKLNFTDGSSSLVAL